jgi:hypothetical protein
MRRTWRFIKWFVSRLSVFDVVVIVTAFTLSFGYFTGEGLRRDIAWSIAIGVNTVFAIVFISKGIIGMWRDFKKHDERVFDILKKEKIK